MRLLSDPPGRPGDTSNTLPWYRNPSIVLPGGLVLIYIFLYILPLGYRPLVIPDEARYSEIPREMVATGDWITPRLAGLRYFEKPPLGYWLNAVSISMFGENEFAVRLPGTLAAGLTSLIVFLLTLKVWKRRRLAVTAALIHMTCLEVYVVGTFNVLDNFVTLFLTAGIYFHYLATRREADSPGSPKLWLLAGLSYGLAFLSKGFLAFAVPVIVLVPWMVWQGYWRALLIRSGWVLMAAALTALPWAVLIHLREGDFWHYFFWTEHIKRFTADDAQHRQPVYYFLMYLPGLAFPWLSLFPAAIAGLRNPDTGNSHEKAARRLLWLWVIVPFLFFSLSNGKLATYILPCFPPFAILTAVGLTRYLEKDRNLLFDFGMLFNLLIFLGLFSGLLISQSMDIGIRPYSDTETGKLILLETFLMLGSLAGLAAILSPRKLNKLVLGFLFIVLPASSINFIVPLETYMHKSPGEQILKYKQYVTDKTILISDTAMMHATGWYLKRDDFYLLGRGEVSYGLDYPDASHRLLDEDRFRQLLKNDHGGRAILVMCKRACPDWVNRLLPPHTRKHTWGTFNFRYLPATDGTQNAGESGQ